jgi:hypothetical protein
MIGRLVRLLAFGWLAASVAAQAKPARTVALAEHQILVMLRLAPPHFRSGTSFSGGYGDDQSRGGRQRIAAAVARNHGLTLVGNWPMPLIGIDCFIMTLPEHRDIDKTAAEISRDGAVEWAQPVAQFRAMGGNRGDPLFSAQPTAKAWHLAALHRVATGRHVKIAVIDSKVDLNHPDLLGQVAMSRDFVTGPRSAGEDHGTGVAGVIAARLANGVGGAGIAPEARLYALRACRQTSSLPATCDTLSLAKAIAFAIEQRVDVINLSLSGPSDRLLGSLIKVGMARGSSVVAAFDSAVPGGGFPASYDGVIAVSASPVGTLRGPYWAPSQDIPTTQPGGRWYLVSGASYAAAEVSGLLALMREKQPNQSGNRRIVSARVQGGEIDACATLLGSSPVCKRSGDGATH